MVVSRCTEVDALQCLFATVSDGLAGKHGALPMWYNRFALVSCLKAAAENVTHLDASTVRALAAPAVKCLVAVGGKEVGR